MLEQAFLRERFESLLKAEQEVVGAYEQMARMVQDPVRREAIAQLVRDKHRHVQLTQRLLELVE